MARFLHWLWSSRPKTYMKPGTEVIKSLQGRPSQLQPHRGSGTGVSAPTGWHQLHSMERSCFLLGLSVSFLSLRKTAAPYSWLDDCSQFLTLSLNDMCFLLALWLGSLSHSRRHCLLPCLTDLEPGHVWLALTKKKTWVEATVWAEFSERHHTVRLAVSCLFLESCISVIWHHKPRDVKQTSTRPATWDPARPSPDEPNLSWLTEPRTWT